MRDFTRQSGTVEGGSMTLDEVIVHEYKAAAEQSEIATELLLSGTDASEYLENKREHEQFAEWLEELKEYRASAFTEDMMQKLLKEEYRKAIDDFAEVCKQDILCQTFGLKPRNIDKIAEQLKISY